METNVSPIYLNTIIKNVITNIYNDCSPTYRHIFFKSEIFPEEMVERLFSNCVLFLFLFLFSVCSGTYEMF